MIFGNAKWIWMNDTPKVDEYADFFVDFDFDGSPVKMLIAAETEYIVSLNGKVILHGQYAGYPTEKYYDEDNITDFCQSGKNSMVITVRYEGVDSFTHINDGAGLIFSLESNGKQIAYSGTHTPSAPSTAYVPYVNREITEQLGTSPTMTSTKGKNAPPPTPSVEANISYNFKKRPIARTEDLAPVSAKKFVLGGRTMYDLGYEECGYVYLKVKCSKDTKVKVAYSEHIADAYVKYLLGPRDFSLDFYCTEGENYFVQYFVRMAGRYFEIHCEDEIEVIDIGVIPCLYPLTEKPAPAGLDPIEKRIYDVSVRTLRLCMHTHYEDCPWREQSLYIVDGRNQMLCGYYAFEESDFQRENLILASKGAREDGMLELTFPARNTPSIPFFSVMYPVAVCEYVEHSGDTSIIPIVMPAMRAIMDRLYSWIDGTGLITNQPKPYWNFYEWSYGNEGRKGFGDAGTHDLMINCAFILANEHLAKLCLMVNEDTPNYDVEAIRSAIVNNFYDKDTDLYFNNLEGNRTYGELGNAFAMLIGLGTKNMLKALKRELPETPLVPATLSMIAYVYDVILKEDYEGGKKFILDDIRRNYYYMLSRGATSFWEVLEGHYGFHEAGSLCHGWSAMPVYYYRKFFEENN